MALGILAIPSSAFATHGGAGKNCPTPAGTTSTTVSNPPNTVKVYQGATTSPPSAKAGACADFNGGVAAGPIRFDGGTAEAAVGEDPGTGAGDPGDPGGTRPDAYAVIDGDDDNADPQGQSDGYVGVSNWETSNGRVTEAQCEAPPPGGGPNNGTSGSSNSGGCVGPAGGPWVFVPEDVPTPICGNTSGNAWDGSGNQGNHKRDGCQFP